MLSGRRREEEAAPGIQNQKQEPHTKLWGKTWFSSQKLHGIYASVYQWRCAIIRYPLGWNAAKADLHKETMAECLIAVKYGKILANDPPDFFEDLPESTNDFHGHNFVTPHKEPLIKPL